MKMFEESAFISLVESTWGTAEAEHKVVSKHDVEALITAIRHNLLKYVN